MKTTIFLFVSLLLSSLLSWGCTGLGSSSDTSRQTYFYAVEINGVLCGYSESENSHFHTEGLPVIQVKDHILVKMTVLGQGMDLTIRNEYLIDSLTGQFTFCRHDISTGATLTAISEVQNGSIVFRSEENGTPKEIPLDADVILESPLSNSHLVRDFVEGDAEKKEYKVYDDMKGEVVTKLYSRVNKETVELAGISYQTTVLDELNESSGIMTRLWISNEGGFPVKFEVAGRKIYLADASVKKQIVMADMDNLLFARVHKIIPDISNITYMKVNATIESQGEWITAEGLNSRGQKFTGTVTDNLVEGVFELHSIRYDGNNAPGFPYDYQLDESLLAHTRPGKLIESDHPDLLLEATNITAGSATSWEAVVKLSRWVSDNIEGAIPGGTSAINTYKTRQGECGSHSRLLAGFCRAAGIPARLATGCMYSTYLGGSFGQHAWTEVYMGDAGWIAVDATVKELDYVDAGHIRLGEETSFKPKEMEIMEYKVGDVEGQPVSLQVPEAYLDLVGKYKGPDKDKYFEILYQDGSLAVDIPDRMVLVLHDQDEFGLYYPVLSRQVNFRFDRNADGAVESMRLQQSIPLSRNKIEPTDTLASDPPPQAGTYSLAQPAIEVVVFVKDNQLLINDPISHVEAPIEQEPDSGIWNIQTTGNQLQFEQNESGEINRLIYFENINLIKTNSHEIQGSSF